MRLSVMNKMRYILLTFAAVVGLIISSCINDDFTDSPSATLTFSTDTLSFGTVFTDLGTPTARLLVFNRNSKGVNVSSIRFRDPDSPFSLNVDGVSGSDFHDVEIRGKDSIYIFIECFVDADASSEPWRVADRLEFVTNGVTQEVEVEAMALNVTRLRGVCMEQDMRLTPERPYVVFDTLTVARGATLTIEPGTQLLFHDKAAMRIEGCIDAKGTPDKPIHFRGDRIDNVLPGVSYDIMAGQWDGISIAPESFGNHLENVNMRSTVNGLRVDSCGDLSRNKLTLINSWLHNSRSTVLDIRYAKAESYGCCFSEAAEAVVRLSGGEYNFTQCTVSNNYLFAIPTEANVSLFHLLPADMGGGMPPLMKASFENCIIYGMSLPLSPTDLSGSAVFVRDCLVKTAGSDDDNFINCLWDEDPKFLTIRSDYYFNYHLQPDSPALGRGNPAYVVGASLYDMDGVDRLTEGPDPGHPTLGAYARPEEPTEP